MTTYYLQMRTPEQLQPKSQPVDFHVIQAQIPNYHVNRFLYSFVGEAWQWTDRLVWSQEAWESYAHSPQLYTYIAYYHGSIAGYYELEMQEEDSVEIVHFGLSPDYIGKGLGGYLLTHAIESAWNLSGTQRVWLHTCSLDHKGALANYQARGFEVYLKEEG